MPESPSSDRMNFKDRLELNIPMSRDEAIQVFCEQFPGSSKEDILEVLVNLRNADENSMVIFTEVRDQSAPRIKMAAADGTWSQLFDPYTGQVASRAS